MKLYRVEDGKVILSPYPAQAQVWRSGKRFTFFIAGTQSGKTALGPWWLLDQIKQGKEGDYLAVTASYDLFKLKMLPEIRTVFEHLLGIGRYWSGDKVIELQDPDRSEFWANRADDPMYGRIILRSASSEGGLESATAKAAWLDEVGQDEFNLSAWEAVLRRLSLSQGRVLGTTTPYNMGWLKTEIWDRWQSGDPDYLVVNAESVDNPAFPQEEFDRAKRTLPTWKFAMFYRGLFERPAGLIYSDFDTTTHVVRPFIIPNEWPRYIGVDFGAIHTAIVWITEDQERQVYYLYREYLEGSKTTQEHVNDAHLLSKHKLKDGAWIGGENIVRYTGGARSEKQQRWDWNDAGMNVQESPVIDVEAGIDRVIELLKSKRLFVFEHCRKAIEEFGTYSRVLGNDGQATEKIKNKEQFHLLDAIRYDVSALEPAVSVIKDPFAGW